jgi:hypothetical protein
MATVDTLTTEYTSAIASVMAIPEEILAWFRSLETAKGLTYTLAPLTARDQYWCNCNPEVISWTPSPCGEWMSVESTGSEPSVSLRVDASEAMKETW